MLYGIKAEVPEEDYVLPLGKAAIRREGNDLTVVSYSRMANRCADVCEKLAEDNIDAEMIDLRCLKPLDTCCIIESVKKTGRLLLVSEGCADNNVGCF